MQQEEKKQTLLKFMHLVITFARGKAWGRNENEIGDLMDAIHNIPLFLLDFEKWDDDFFKENFLHCYDQKWSKNGGLNLKKMYERLTDESET